MPSSVEYEDGPDYFAIVAAAGRKGLKAAGEAVLVESDFGAPRSVRKRHAVHMDETGYVRRGIDGNGDAEAVIAYHAWYALLQHENLAYHHPNGGHAKFLEAAMIEMQEAAIEIINAAIRAAL